MKYFKNDVKRRDSTESKMNLKNLTPDVDLSEKEVEIPDINRPALQLTGFFEHFDSERVQIIGYVEYTFLEKMTDEVKKKKIYETLLSYKIPCLIFCRNLPPEAMLLEMAEKANIPVFQTEKKTSEFTAEIIRWLNVQLAPCISIHGVLVDVYGEGILITGESGIGKSETAIELVKRGHRLIADDAVEIKKVSPHELVGSAPPVLKHYIELRGIGVINVAKLFGMGAVKESSNIDLIINMVPWRDGEAYDRLGMETQYTEILDVKVPSITVPITPGRNLAVIFEVAAMNNRQKRMGYNAAVEFTEQMSKFFANKDD
mgnify:CR=1 FL=1